MVGTRNPDAGRGTGVQSHIGVGGVPTMVGIYYPITRFGRPDSPRLETRSAKAHDLLPGI
jgi:hypothetical protein